MNEANMELTVPLRWPSSQSIRTHRVCNAKFQTLRYRMMPKLHLLCYSRIRNGRGSGPSVEFDTLLSSVEYICRSSIPFNLASIPLRDDILMKWFSSGAIIVDSSHHNRTYSTPENWKQFEHSLYKSTINTFLRDTQSQYVVVTHLDWYIIPLDDTILTYWHT